MGDYGGDVLDGLMDHILAEIQYGNCANMVKLLGKGCRSWQIGHRQAQQLGSKRMCSSAVALQNQIFSPIPSCKALTDVWFAHGYTCHKNMTTCRREDDSVLCAGRSAKGPSMQLFEAGKLQGQGVTVCVFIPPFACKQACEKHELTCVL